MHRILKLRHWQLFLLLLFLYLSGNLFPALFVVFYCLAIALWISWMYSFVLLLSRDLPAEKRRDTAYFRFTCLLYVSYTVFVLILFNGGYSITNDNYRSFGNLLWILIPLHLYGMWSILYILYVAAKTLALAGEVRNPQAVGNTSSWFMALLFFYIGIWFIQPKVQHLLADNKAVTNHS